MQELQGLVKEEGIEGADLLKKMLQGHNEEEVSNPLKGLVNLKDFTSFSTTSSISIVIRVRDRSYRIAKLVLQWYPLSLEFRATPR